MKLKGCLFSFALLATIFTLSSTATPLKGDCSAILKSAGASEDFGANVGHAIHSMNLRALKKLDPTATENNRVPTINMNLGSDEALLPNAPDRRGPSDEKFLSEGMKTLDEVLSEMDNPTYDIKFFTPLEKVVHAFHMEEAWAMVGHQYRLIKEKPRSVEACHCVMDVENNGVLKMLRFIALGIREPQLIYGENLKLYRPDADKRISYKYNFFPKKEFRENNRKLGMEQLLMDEEQSMPRLTDAAAWEKWKEIGAMKMEDHSSLPILCPKSTFLIAFLLSFVFTPICLYLLRLKSMKRAIFSLFIHSSVYQDHHINSNNKKNR